MYIIIAGCRKVGSNLALELSQENHNVVVIDSEPGNLEALGSGFNGVSIAGMPIDEDVLRNAGIEQADALAAVTNDDNMNIMISEVAREMFQVPIVITRVYDPERDAIMSGLGMTTVCATTLAVRQLKNMLTGENGQGTVTIKGSEIMFRMTRPAARLIGKNMSEIKNGPVLGIIHKGSFMLSDPKTVVGPDDMLIVAEYAAIGE